LEAHSGGVEAYPVIMEAHPGAMQAFPVDVEPWRKINYIGISS
jgi:hypothetical protein